MTLQEVFVTYILPIGGLIGGMSAVLIFILSGHQRKAETERIKAETEKAKSEAEKAKSEAEKAKSEAEKNAAEKEEVITLTPAKFQQMVTESAEKIFAAQGKLIDDMRAHLSRSDKETNDLKERFEREIGSREATIENLKQDLVAYQQDNARLTADNIVLNNKVAEQDKEITRLNKKIIEQDQEIQKLKTRFDELMETKNG